MKLTFKNGLYHEQVMFPLKHRVYINCDPYANINFTDFL